MTFVSCLRGCTPVCFGSFNRNFVKAVGRDGNQSTYRNVTAVQVYTNYDLQS
jgi:hypothetical protein